MSGFEVVGAVAAAASLIELSSKCTKRLIQIKSFRDDATARDLSNRVELLTEVIKDVFKVLHDIYAQPTKQQPFTNAESTIWNRMKAVLLLCQQQLEGLHKQLKAVSAKTEGFVDRTKEAVKLSVFFPNLKRVKDDIDTYMNALNMLKGLLQVLATHRHGSLQHVMHQDIREMKEHHGDKLDDALQGISQIKDELQRRPLHHNHTDSGHYSDHTLTADDEVDSLSIHLEQILIAAADIKTSINDPTTYTPSSSSSARSPESLTDPSTVSNLAETQSIQSMLEADSLPDVTHAEPLKELAVRFHKQAEHDFTHRHYHSAEYHQLESIKCYQELHDVHGIVFDSYHDMKMMLAKILRMQKKFMEAQTVLSPAQKGRLLYESEPGCMAVPTKIDDDANDQANASKFMAEVHLEMFQSGTSLTSLNEAEKHAKRAFQLQREISGKDHPDLKNVVELLVKIYSSDIEKPMYAEIYRNIYLSDLSRQDSIALSHRTSFTSALTPMLASNIIDAIKQHNGGDEQDVSRLIDESSQAAVDLDEMRCGKSAMMTTIDCDCERCDNIMDKLLRSGAGRNISFQYAIQQQKLEKCTRLLRFDADIDWLDSDKMTPLMNAIKREHKNMVSFLISKRANLDVRGEDGRTALHIAIQTRNADILKLLLDNKDYLNLNSKDRHGLTALHYCAKYDKPRLAKRLHRAGADLEVRDNSDRHRTPLWIAVREGKYSFAETLLEIGAKVDMNYLPTTQGDMRNLLKKYIND